MYSLWDRELGNQIGEFYTPDEALETAWVVMEADPDLADRLALIRDEPSGDTRVLAGGPLRQAARSRHMLHVVEADPMAWLEEARPTARDWPPPDGEPTRPRTSVPPGLVQLV